ncbi:formimidoylglutamase [uncultured Amphritea sp.]|uniref:formimidoylglutamase n=1 Tax=uncultured Amphritea sp. TaxID=981605 RepID=UPI002614294F|nr:formimidoylglutamase [uncultured Amphritea sp.]
MSEYSTAFDAIWKGRIDTEELPELANRLHQQIQPLTAGTAAETADSVAIIGFCSDAGVRRNRGRVGARRAPDLLRSALASLPWSVSRPAWDAGNVVCEGDELEAAHQALADQVQDCLSAGHFPVVLGGGHEVAYGSWLGLSHYLQGQSDISGSMPNIGIINFDAHFDMRLDSNGCSSGTPFYQIAQQCQANNWPFKYCCLGVSEMSNTAALFQRADQLHVTYRKDSELDITRLTETTLLLQQFMADCDQLYLTIDLDVLPAAVAPGVSAPAARGVGLEILEPLIETIIATGKLKLADLAEYNPEFDIDNRTARVAARLFHCIVKRG